MVLKLENISSMKKIAIVTPHCDDETIGCGGTILKHVKNGDQVFWIIVTKPHKRIGFDNIKLKKHAEIIKKISTIYKFQKTYELNFPAAELDTIPQKEIISKITKIYNDEKIQVVYQPFYGDVHGDHKIISECSTSSVKWFRNNSVEKVLEYETISETDFSLNDKNIFFPNMFVDISEFIENKIDICKIYKDEFGEHPFPRSLKNIESLSILRGSSSGFKHAEAFKILKLLIS